MGMTPDTDRKRARQPSSERVRQRRRIWRTTRALAVGGVAATAAFVFAAAHAGHRPATSTPTVDSLTGSADAGVVPLSSDDGTSSADDGGEGWDDGGGPYSSIAPSQAAPTPSTLPPVARSGGS
jgi:hypothetical protein